MAELFVTQAKPTQTITGVVSSPFSASNPAPTILPPKPSLSFYKYDDTPEVWDNTGHHYSSMAELTKAAGGTPTISTIKRPAPITPIAPVANSTPSSIFTPPSKPMVFPLTPNTAAQVTAKAAAYNAADEQVKRNVNSPLLMNKDIVDTARSIPRSALTIDATLLNKNEPIQASTPLQRFLIGDEPVQSIQRSVADKEVAQGISGRSPIKAYPLAFMASIGPVMDLFPGLEGEGKALREATDLIGEQLLKGITKDEALNAVYTKFGTKVGQQIEKEVLPKIEERIAQTPLTTVTAEGRQIHLPITEDTIIPSTAPSAQNDYIFQGGKPGTKSAWWSTNAGEANAYATQKGMTNGEIRVAKYSDLPVEVRTISSDDSIAELVRKKFGDSYLDRPLTKDEYSKIRSTIGFNKDVELPLVGTIPADKTGLKSSEELLSGFKPPEPKLELPPVTKKDSLLQKFKNVLDPIKGTDQATQDSYRTWSNAVTAGKELANQEAKNLVEVPQKQGLDTILKYEKGETTPFSAKIKQTFDNLYHEATAKGIEVPYRENYVPQMYKNSPEEVTAAMAKYMKDKGVDPATIDRYLNGKDIPEEVSKTLKLNPDFTKQRVFPDYKTAMEYGLTPKYTHPAQLASAYRQSLETAAANKTFVTDLLAQGKIVPARSAPKGWEPVSLSFAPKGMAAEPKLANALNGLYRNELNLTFGQTVGSGIAKTSKVMQEVALSAGFPGTDVNFFSMGQLIKEVTAGNVKAIPAFIRANFDSASIRFFEDKAPIIQKMADHGIDLTDRVGNFRDLYKNMVGKDSFKEILGNGWDMAFQKKTFASFMPQLYVNTYEGAYKTALKKGLSEELASDLAAKVTRNYHGLLENNARSKGTEDALSAVFFAPKFREGIINTLLNTGKSLTTEIRNPAFGANRKLAIGMALTYAGYQYLNKKLTGNYTWQNEPGHEFDLKIPLPNQKGVLYVPFMPSFMSLPRNLGSAAMALQKGDLATATQKGTSLLSMPLQITSQIMTNSDYFGNKIYKDTDTRVERLKKIGQYLGLQANHPYLKLIGNYIDNKQEPDKQFRKPLVQSLIEASEFPVKFDTLDRLSRSQFYAAADKKTADNAAATRKIQPIYDHVQQLKDQGNVDEAQKIVDGLSDQDYEAYKNLKASGKRSDTTGTEAKLYDTYQHVQQLVSQGNETEAQRIVDGLSDDEYKAYSLLKKRFNP